MSETPTPEPPKPDTEELKTLQQKLTAADDLLKVKNVANAELESKLTAIREEKLEASLKIDSLESELASRPTQSETSATVGTDLSKVEAADLLNQLKTHRKKSKADLADMDAVLEILEGRSWRNNLNKQR